MEQVYICPMQNDIDYLKQWFPTGEEFLPREEFHEFKGGIFMSSREEFSFHCKCCASFLS